MASNDHSQTVEKDENQVSQNYFRKDVSDFKFQKYAYGQIGLSQRGLKKNDKRDLKEKSVTKMQDNQPGAKHSCHCYGSAKFLLFKFWYCLPQNVKRNPIFFACCLSRHLKYRLFSMRAGVLSKIISSLPRNMVGTYQAAPKIINHDERVLFSYH